MRTHYKWSVFRQREDHGELHVIPSYPDGTIVEHHIVDVLCPCNPTPEPRKYTGEKIIVVHNDPELER
jgi:hypothetical protein